MIQAFLNLKNRLKSNNKYMEKQFLLYLLYISLIDIRARSYENNDKTTFWLCDLLHNIPLRLNSEEEIKDAYERLLDNINSLGVQDWLDTRMKEFYEKYPEYNRGENG
jgi:hypothetical protein